MSDRTPEFIRKEWREFQASVTRCHGKEMDGDDAMEIIQDLLAEHKKGMLHAVISSWPPKDLIALADVVLEASPKEKPKKGKKPEAALSLENA